MKEHYFDGAGICMKCDNCADPLCCEQSEECYGTNWDFMYRIPELVKEIEERRKNG